MISFGFSLFSSIIISVLMSLKNVRIIKSCENNTLFCKIIKIEMYVQIDPDAGFCFGVKRAIALAEDSLAKHGEIHSLGQIVHNEQEEDRLQGLGLKTITSYDPEIPVGKTILIRAHGEPPSTYLLAKKNQITLIDATCPIVKKLQEKVRDTYLETKKTNGQIVIIGKKKHPEVIGLAGQTNGEAIVVENEDDLI
ncbi:MAG: hypothetical protein EOM23_07565, partial [Candidatus Moranbacteria bacterium]|nr:hypothetical protein [Candidatus Moranbacteria bacterium]